MKLEKVTAKLTLSPIMKWKEEGIIAQYGNVTNFVKAYMDRYSRYGRSVLQFLSQDAYRIQIEYFDFDWEYNSYENSFLRSTSFW